MSKQEIKAAIAITLIAYLFGSVCAGSLNIGDWDEGGRIVLAVIWVWLLSQIEIKED